LALKKLQRKIQHTVPEGGIHADVGRRGRIPGDVGVGYPAQRRAPGQRAAVEHIGAAGIGIALQVFETVSIAVVTQLPVGKAKLEVVYERQVVADELFLAQPPSQRKAGEEAPAGLRREKGRPVVAEAELREVLAQVI